LFFRHKVEKAPKGKSESPWSLHIGIFQILLSIIFPNGITYRSLKNPVAIIVFLI
jgi:hypothetical protein